jgi:hypothetical protein
VEAGRAEWLRQSPEPSLSLSLSLSLSHSPPLTLVRRLVRASDGHAEVAQIVLRRLGGNALGCAFFGERMERGERERVEWRAPLAFAVAGALGLLLFAAPVGPGSPRTPRLPALRGAHASSVPVPSARRHKRCPPCASRAHLFFVAADAPSRGGRPFSRSPDGPKRETPFAQRTPGPHRLVQPLHPRTWVTHQPLCLL